jgi:hypothetical protein
MMSRDYIEAVTFNNEILRKLKVKSWGDRLGDLIVFTLKEYPNESISYTRTLEWFKHILALCGYTYEHIKDLDGGEMCECWIYPADTAYTKMVVRHKYLSLKTCTLIKEILRQYCKLNHIPFKVVSQFK